MAIDVVQVKDENPLKLHEDTVAKDSDSFATMQKSLQQELEKLQQDVTQVQVFDVRQLSKENFNQLGKELGLKNYRELALRFSEVAGKDCNIDSSDLSRAINKSQVILKAYQKLLVPVS